LNWCYRRGLDARKFDITRDELPADLERRDIALSFEVAEHLQERYADRFVALLCRASETIVISAATPGQGGLDHVNEQEHSYWIAKFTLQGYTFDEMLSTSWRSRWKEKGAVKCYYNNLMIFRAPRAGRGQA
jgi:hypothetical protein